MLDRLAALAVRRRAAVLVLTPLLLVVFAVLGAGVAERLGTGGWHAATDESTRAAAAVDAAFDTGPANLVLLVTADTGVDDPASAAAGLELSRTLAADPRLRAVTSYWLLGRSAALRSPDGRMALVTARVVGDEDQVRARTEQVHAEYSGRSGPLSVRVGGQPAVERELVERSEADLRRSELAAAPVVALVLLLVFGGAVAAALPFAVGLVAVLGTMAVLTGLSMVTDVSVFSLNITTALGFGLAVDYGLFMVTRFREELDAGSPVPDAVATTVATAGRTVLFSALTVAISLASLLVFPLYYLRSFAYAGIAVVVLAAAAAVVVLPAALATLGHRVDALPVRAVVARIGRGSGRHRAPDDLRGGRPRTGSGFWHRLARLVMRRPFPVGVPVVVLLVVLGLPFAGATFALPDDRLLPARSESHAVSDALRRDFPDSASNAVFVVAPEVPDLGNRAAEVAGYAASLSTLGGVVRVDAMTGSYAAGQPLPTGPAERFVNWETGSTWLSVVTHAEAYSPESERLVRNVRALGPPFAVLVGGDAAHLVDTKATLGRGLPWALLVVAASTLLVLFLFTGSVLIPVKAVLLNLLSLTATFGVMVWGFQNGHLRGLVGDFQVTGTLELTTPILMFCIAFGLAMDYEVFLLSRIKEEWDRTRDNTAAVALGLERTGRLVSSAALVVVVVLAALATSDLTLLKLLGVGLALAVAVDATLVRGLLVPAFMRVAGTANWWAPAPLRWLHGRFGLSENAVRLGGVARPDVAAS